MNTLHHKLAAIPSVDSLLKQTEISLLIEQHGRPLVVYAVRIAIDRVRNLIVSDNKNMSSQNLSDLVVSIINSITQTTLKPVINATGIILHTNLGRAVLGENVLTELSGIVTGYSTIEYDTATGARGNRHSHIAEVLRYITGAEDSLVVNNNAAAIILALSTLAKGREVIISRGELIEIGGEFRIPEIMEAAGCIMVEVGTTNRTRIADYEKAITDKTALIFKAHKSNFSMQGFVEEASIEDCVQLAHKKNIPFVYDIGSGLLKTPSMLKAHHEPDVTSSLSMGADLVLFSCDKLLGGPQAGIIAGKKEFVSRCATSPLMRALRVGKLTMSALSTACRSYCNDDLLMANNPTFSMLSRDVCDIRRSADLLANALLERNIPCRIAESSGQCGGGTLPDLVIPSFAVVLDKTAPAQQDTSRKMFDNLLQQSIPVVAILREGTICFDMLTVFDRDILFLTNAIDIAYNTLREAHG